MSAIFYFSGMPGYELNDKSKAVIQNVVKKTESEKVNEEIILKRELKTI